MPLLLRVLMLLVSVFFFLPAQAIDITTPIANNSPSFTVAEVQSIVANTVAYLKSIKETGVISVTDREGHILALFRMTTTYSTDYRINEQATAKARTASFFESDDNAFSTRTAQFIVQSNFPPGIRNVDAGPLFGVPFSNFPGADVQLQVPPAIVFANALNSPNDPALVSGAPAIFPALSTSFRPLLQPLVITPLTDDLGGVPLFKQVGPKKFAPAGGLGVEIDGFGVLGNGVADKGVGRTDTGVDPKPSKRELEEAAAVYGSKGFEAPAVVKGSTIVVNGFRFPYLNPHLNRNPIVPLNPATLDPAEGKYEPFFDTDGTERSPGGLALVNAYVGPFSPTAVTITSAMQPRATPIQEFPRRGFVGRFPARNSPAGVLTIADVNDMVQHAADTAILTRAAIRNPAGRPAAVWVSIVDINGDICGVYRTEDATVFSYDLSVQKARTALFFSSDKCGITSRAVGFMAQTTYPPGVGLNPAGPISGLQSGFTTDAGALGLFPSVTGNATLTEISQLLTDRDFSTLFNLVQSLGPTPVPFGKVSFGAVQLLARRLPHIRDGRISPLQAAITVDMTLRNTYAPAIPAPSVLRNGITVFPGGVPIYKNGVLVGGLGISGDGVDQDDFIAFAGQTNFKPPAGVRCDETPEAVVKATLQGAVAKLKLDFPALTSGNNASPAVLDVIEARLITGSILQGLRLPYVKFPRSPLIK